MGNFIKKCTSMLLLVSILCTTVFPSSFASYADEAIGVQGSNIDPIRTDVPSDAQNVSDNSVERTEEIAGAVLKIVALDTQASQLGDEEKIGDRFRIKDIVLDELGEPIPGVDATKESIIMRLSYDGELSLDSIVKTKITQVLIDEVSYELEEEGNGYKNFFLFEGKKLGIAAAYPEGERAVNDFKKREYHRVEIIFDDGSTSEYQDSDYKPRDFNTDPAPPPATKKPKPPVQLERTVKGYLANKTDKKKKSMAHDALVSEIHTRASKSGSPGMDFVDILVKFNEISKGNIKGKITSVSYKAMNEMKEAKLVADKEGTFAVLYPAFALPPVNSSEDTEIELEFTIDLGQGQSMKQSAILILDWNNDFQFEDEGTQPPSPKPKDGIGNTYSIKKIELGDSNTLNITLNKNIVRADYDKIEYFKVNGKTFTQKDTPFMTSMLNEDQLSNGFKAVVDQVNKRNLDELELEIWFTDGSVLKNKAKGPAQPPQEEDKEREVKGYMLETGKTKVSPANKAIRDIKVKPVKSTETQGKKFYEVIIRLAQAPIGDDKTAKIKELSYNQDKNTKLSAETVKDYMYDSYKMLIPAEQIQPKNSTKDTEIRVQYQLDTDQSGFNKPFDAILLLDWNDDFDEPGNFAKKFEIKNVELKENPKEIRVTLNKELLNSKLSLVKHVKVNDDSFALKTSDLAQAQDNKVLIIKKQEVISKAQEKVSTGWTFKIVFEDKSELEYYVKKKSTPTPPPAPPAQPGDEIAKKYKIKEVLKDQGWQKNQLHIEFDKQMDPKDAQKINKVTVNGTVFEEASKIFFRNFDGRLETANAEVLKAARSKEPIIVIIEFNDGSVLSNGAVTPPPANPGQGIAGKHEIISVGFGTGYSANDLQITFKGITGINDSVALHKQMKTIEINGSSFAASVFKGSYDGYITTSDEDVAKAARSKDKITVKITFTDDSVLTNDGSSTPPPPPQQPNPPQDGVAKGHVIESMKVDKEDKEFWIFFEKEVPYFWNNRIVKIQLDGQDFEVKPEDLTMRSSSILIKRKDILDKVYAVQDINKMGIIISFNDGSQIKKNVVDVPKVPDIKIGDKLENGTYTLTYQAYKEGSTTDISTFGGFFDIRAKLVVSGGKRTITLLNHTAADLMLDFAVKTGNNFKSVQPTNITHGFKGEKSSAEYTFDIEELTGRHVVAILGSGPMGGNQGEVGQFDNPNYKKADIVFNEEVIKGWTDFKFPEDIKKNAEESHKRLIEGLIKNNVDTDKDGKISEQELNNATGIKTLVAGEMRSNVIDLEGIKIDDISLLKHLGPKVKVLNINGCKIKSLPQDVFQNATGLQAIYLGGNEIQEIKPGTFDKLVNLDYIDFDGNRLGALPEGIFDKNVELESVSFMNSGVTSVPAGMLKNLSALKYLYLQENSIKEIPDGFFAGSERLLEVHLHYNKLKSLPSSLGSVKKLKLITAQHNEIKRIPDSFSQLKRLETLDLESNQLEYIPTALYTNMIRLASITQVRLDLSMNNLRELPIDEMIAALESGGNMLTKFEVNKNYLKPVVTKDEESKMRRLGIDFERSKESYYPQKGSIESSLMISNGTIQLSQEFDILELYYWDQGDSSYYGGKEEFKSKEEFLKYLLGEGRDYHKVDRGLDRDVAIQTILNKKGVKWEVETIIMKNGHELSRTTSKNNAKEGLKQTFQDASMKTGDKYTLTKRLNVKGVFGWALALENTVEGTATGNAQPPNTNEKTVKVQVHKFGTSEASVANQAINPNAKIVNKNGKFEYTVEFKPLKVVSAEGNIIKFSVDINGELKEITETPATTSGYTKAYTFTLDKESKKVDVVFEADVMNQFNGNKPNPQKAHLVFGDENTQPQPKKDRMIKAYILKENEDKPSMANKALVHDVELKAIGNEYEVKLQFNDMTMGSITAGVDSLSVTLDANKIEATKVAKGVFTFKMPASMVKGENVSEDTKLPIEFTAKGNGFDKQYKATLLLDWNKDYKLPNEEMPLDGRKIPAQILTADGKKVSMAGKALEGITVKPSDKTSGPFKLVTMTFKFKELQMKKTNATINALSSATAKAGVKTLEVKVRDKWMQATPVDGQNGTFTLEMFENVIQDEQSLEDTKFAIRITTDVQIPGHTEPQEAMLVLDWNGDLKVDDQDNVITPPAPPVPPTPPPGGGSGGSGSSQETMTVSVWMKKKSDGTVSMGNRALNPYAKVVRDGSRYTYTITLNPIQIEFGGQKFEGEVSNIQLIDPPAGLSYQSVGNSKEYSFELNERVPQVLVSFEVDGAAFMGTQEAYIVFDWNGNNSAPNGGQPGAPGGGGGGINIPENLVPLAGPSQSEKDIEAKAIRIINNKDTEKFKRYYKPETIKAIMKALESYQNKEKDSLQKLEAALEVARLERITSILSVGYMSGYPNRQFRPDNKITRAEVSAMFMELIEDEAKEKVAFKDVKDGLWYSEAANKMVSLGYIRMNGEGMFAPDKAITRAEYAYILAKLKKLPTSDKKIKDVPEDHWAADAIASCIEAGIIAGYNDGTFRPDREITRAEAVAMMSRAFDITSNVKGKKAYNDVSKKHWAYDVIMTASKN